MQDNHTAPTAPTAPGIWRQAICAAIQGAALEVDNRHIADRIAESAELVANAVKAAAIAQGAKPQGPWVRDVCRALRGSAVNVMTADDARAAVTGAMYLADALASRAKTRHQAGTKSGVKA